ncbi:hypothetical protein [Rhodococcoides fascians]|uniref:hypothetical protein n=1 Tax=Rhodococcoides fascians TaxID=1828 RepID=UPI0012D2CD18|nr:hypothetical protein [Rhodococcus fascians]
MKAPAQLSLRPVDGHTARNEIARSLALQDQSDDESRRYEMLRAVTWASTYAETPVYIRTLLDRSVAVDKSLHLDSSEVSESERRNRLRGQLDVLADLGDFAELGNGYWVSVPGVIVESETQEPDMLVSGVPLRVLDHASRDSITCTGAARHITDATLSGHLKLPKVGLWLWAMRPDSDLSTWTKDFIETSRIFEGPLDDPEFYVPAAARPGSIQAIRWVPGSKNLNGTYLYRHTVLSHWRVHGLARVEAGKVTGTCEIDRDDARRLMYGFDLHAGNPTKATWYESPNGVAEVTLHNSVPAPEIRALTALGRRLPASKYNYKFDATSHRDQILQMLEDLGIDLGKDMRHG